MNKRGKLFGGQAGVAGMILAYVIRAQAGIPLVA
jgi:hypothetical protein